MIPKFQTENKIIWDTKKWPKTAGTIAFLTKNLFYVDAIWEPVKWYPPFKIQELHKATVFSRSEVSTRGTAGLGHLPKGCPVNGSTQYVVLDDLIPTEAADTGTSGPAGSPGCITPGHS